jgi:hypothetical protein
LEGLTSNVFVTLLTKAKEEPNPKSKLLRLVNALKEFSGAKAPKLFNLTGIFDEEYLYFLKVNCS